MSTETPIVIFNNQMQVFVLEGKTSFTHLTRRSFVEVTCSGFSFNISDFILPIPNSFVARKTDAPQLSAKGFRSPAVFLGAAGTSALCSLSRHCRHFCAHEYFQALQALPIASCLQRYNKEAIIAHHWSDRILPDGALFLASSLFPMDLRIGAPSSIVFPMALRHSASASRHPAKAPWLVSSAAAPRPASPLQLLGQQLRRSARTSSSASAPQPASNKPHSAEKSTPVWLAIWHTWAGFANSQHRDAAFATPDNICAHSSLLPHWAAAQTDANL